MELSREHVYEITLKVFGYYDWSFTEMRTFTYTDPVEFLEAIQICEEHKGEEYLGIVNNHPFRNKEDDDKVWKFFSIDSHVSTIFFPDDVHDAIRNKTTIYESVNIDKLNRISKIKKLKERSKLCSE